MVDYVTWAGMIAGSAVIFVALVIALRKNDFPKNAYVFLGIGAFLLGGSQWASFRVSPSGIEVLRSQIKGTAGAADEIAAQTQQMAIAVKAIQTEVANLTSLRERRKVVQPDAARRLRLNAMPKIDVMALDGTRENLSLILQRPPSA